MIPTLPATIVESIVAGTNVTVDATDPSNPIVSASGGGAFVPLTDDSGTPVDLTYTEGTAFNISSAAIDPAVNSISNFQPAFINLATANVNDTGYVIMDSANITIGSQDSTDSSSMGFTPVSIDFNSASVLVNGSPVEADAIEVTVTTANATAAKLGTTVGGTYSTPAYGDRINVNFTSGCNANTATLSIDGGSATNIRLGNANITTSTLGIAAAVKIPMWFDGTYWQIYGSYHNTDTNTTYTATGTTWASISGTTQTAAVNTGYLANNAAQVTITLPATAAVGAVVEIIGLAAGGWRVTAASGDDIRFNGSSVASGSYVSGGQYTQVVLRCIVANTTWMVVNTQGTVT